MEISQLQSLYKRNSTTICDLEREIVAYRADLKQGILPENYAPFVYSRITVYKRKIAKLVTLQKAIKKELKTRTSMLREYSGYAGKLMRLMDKNFVMERTA